MKSSRILILFFFLLSAISPGCSTGPGSVSEEASGEASPEPSAPSGTPYVILETDQGDITIKLLSEAAPETVARFIELAEVGFYNRTLFHRVMAGRMIQGGDPLSRDNNPYNDGQGTSGSYLPKEFSDLPFERGTVAMGRDESGDNGGSCQFFIVLKRTPEWDGQYNVFGKVVEGLETADRISQVPLSKSDHPSMKYRPAGKQVIKRTRVEYRES